MDKLKRIYDTFVFERAVYIRQIPYGSLAILTTPIW